ncbi:23324_t:CDS:1, partial [Racocetra persica]
EASPKILKSKASSSLSLWGRGCGVLLPTNISHSFTWFLKT